MKKYVLLILLNLSFVSLSAGQTPSSVQERWHGDKYSMFIHFGVYSELGGVWNGEPVRRGYSEQIQSHGGIQSDLYEKIAKTFNPSLFDADSIACLAKEAGMRSIVITSKHHDGFCLFKTSTTEFNSWDTPENPRDFLAELSEACRRHGIKFGLYFSLIDWHDPYGHPITSHNADPVTPEHHEFNMRQVRELCSNYGPISELWFDMGSLTPQQSKDLYDLVHSLQPDCMVSGRLGNDCYDFCVMSDNSYPDGTLKTPWQAPASMFGATWGYRSWQVREDPAAKASEKLHSLLGTVSHGGNFLLNIGPKGDGSIVEFERDVLLRIGSWLKSNGEAVYDTEAFAWPGIDDWGYCTRKGSNIYLIPSSLSSDTTVVVATGKAKLLGAEYLDDGSKVKARISGGNCRIEISAGDAGPMPRAVRLRFDRQVAEPLAKAPLDGKNTVLTSFNAVPDYSYSCFDYYSNYKSVIAYSWNVKAEAQSLTLTYPEGYRGRGIALEINGKPLTVSLGGDVSCTLEPAGVHWGEMSIDRSSACRTVTADKDCDIVVEVTSGIGLSLSLNGQTVAKHLNEYGADQSKEQYILHLTKGENLIVEKPFYKEGKPSEVYGIEPVAGGAVYSTVVTLPKALDSKRIHTIRLTPETVTNPHADIELSNLEIRFIAR